MNSFLYFIYLGFFLSHIPITMFVDSQAGEQALPKAWPIAHLFSKGICAAPVAAAAGRIRSFDNANLCCQHRPWLRLVSQSSPRHLDSCMPAVLPASWFPSVCRKMMAWYFETHRDPLVRYSCFPCVPAAQDVLSGWLQVLHSTLISVLHGWAC